MSRRDRWTWGGRGEGEDGLGRGEKEQANVICLLEETKLDERVSGYKRGKRKKKMGEGSKVRVD